MEQLLPPLSAEQLSALEGDIVQNGCYASIIVDEDMVVVDDHNRLRICEKYGLPFKMLAFSFVDLLEVKQRALNTQKGRRNLDKWELAQAVGLGERTMGKMMKIDEHAPSPIREALDSGELSISQGYNLMRQLQNVSEENRTEAAAQAVELVKAQKEISQLNTEAKRRGKIAKLFCNAFERAVLLTPSEENARLWVEGTRMRPDEAEDSAKEAEELSELFAAIAKILRTMQPVKAT